MPIMSSPDDLVLPEDLKDLINKEFLYGEDFASIGKENPIGVLSTKPSHEFPVD